MSSFDFPFGIEFVCDTLGLGEKRWAGSSHFTTTCPVCGKKNKLDINVDKNTFRCPVCCDSDGMSGGMLKLYSISRGVDNKTACKELFEAYNGGTDDFRARIRERRERPAVRKPNIASLDQRSAGYNAILNSLTLYSEHYKDLLRRGLTPEMIQILGYKSTPQKGGLRAANKLLASSGVSLAGVPGTIKTSEGRGLPYRREGYFAPVRTLDWRISMMQIRNDRYEDGKKYSCFASGEEKQGISSSGCENIHHTGFWKGADISVVGITEGVIKADVASFLSGRPFIGLTGVSNYSQLDAVLAKLKEIGVKTVYDCFDMDRYTNKHVEASIQHSLDKIKASGLNLEYAPWPREYKGIDDYLLAKKLGKI